MGRPKLIQTERRCKRCSIVKPTNDFYQITIRDVQGEPYPAYRHVCIDCEKSHNLAKYHKLPSEQKRNTKRRYTKYNLTEESFHALLEAQAHICPICGKPDPTYVDHDHNCCDGQHSCGKCVRGILCRNCNTALGMLSDSPEALKRAAQYLEGTR